MNKCCGECAWYTCISTNLGRCSWSLQQIPFWCMIGRGLPGIVEPKEGSNCLAFVPVKEEI
jgi:hypothetical protein